MASARAWQRKPGAWSLNAAVRKGERNLRHNLNAVVTTTNDAGQSLKPIQSRRLPRENRLLDEKAYSRVFGNAGRSRDALFTVLYRSREANSAALASMPARLGLAVSKKNCRLAVGRNRIKRIVRESFRAHQQELHGVDLVVLNKPKTHDAANSALFASLKKHWQKCQRDTQDRAGQEPDG